LLKKNKTDPMPNLKFPFSTDNTHDSLSSNKSPIKHEGYKSAQCNEGLAISERAFQIAIGQPKSSQIFAETLTAKKALKFTPSETTDNCTAAESLCSFTEFTTPLITSKKDCAASTPDYRADAGCLLQSSPRKLIQGAE
jgi:hypothetical protein